MNVVYHPDVQRDVSSRPKAGNARQEFDRLGLVFFFSQRENRE